MNPELFIKEKDGTLLEGPLSDQPTKLLIVMKEPNGDSLNCFWLKKVVHRTEKGKMATKYYNTLGAFAKTFLNESTHNPALKKCAYINLYPFDGKSTVKGGGYINLIKLWKNQNINSDNYDIDVLKSTLNNRLQIIGNALNSGISVAAHYEIANMLLTDNTFKDKFKKTQEYPDNKYHISSYKYGAKAKLYAIPHPSRQMSYCNLAKILAISSVYPES